MPSPFPGMDPYIETSLDWLSFHNTYIAYCVELLNEVLPPQYVATPASQIRLVSPEEREYQDRIPDAVVARRAGQPSNGGEHGPSAVATLQPQLLELPDRWLEVDEWVADVRHQPEHALVAAVELLSPTNKRAPGREEYAAKRFELIARGVNLVELDLLIGGQRLEMRSPLPAADYFALVSRAERRPVSEVYAWGLRDPLPTVPVPLRATDGDAPLDLAEVFRRTFERGKYDRLVRYDAPPPGSLSADDRAWATELAGGAQRR